MESGESNLRDGRCLFAANLFHLGDRLIALFHLDGQEVRLCTTPIRKNKIVSGADVAEKPHIWTFVLPLLRIRRKELDECQYFTLLPYFPVG